MKLLFLLSFIIISNCCCQHNQNKDCTKFKKGKFYIHSELANKTYSITRKGTLQYETEIETGNKTEWKINWLNDCEYSLLMIRDNFGLLKSGKWQTAPYYTFKIIYSTNDYYIFENRYDPAKPLMIDTIWKTD